MASPNDVDTSKIDFYEFLGLPQGPVASAKEINRAGRQTSFRYHPDKVAATPENLEKFHIAQIAIGVLSDPEQKAKYDQQREARLRRKAEVEALDERRRKMAEDLESRERNGANIIAGQKRTFSEREMKIRAAQEANRRKVEERNAKNRLDAERKAAEERIQATKAEANGASRGDHNGSKEAKPSAIPAENDEDSISHSIRLRWVREAEGQGYDEGTISDLFPEGTIENVVLLKDKKRKIEGRGKVVMGTAVVMFVTSSAAKKAMTQKGSLVDKFESIDWMDSGTKDE